jgi:hypothetical protein
MLKGLAKEELRTRGPLGDGFCRPTVRAVFRAFAHDRTPDQLTRYIHHFIPSLLPHHMICHVMVVVRQ